jgi:hypothetical protein
MVILDHLQQKKQQELSAEKRNRDFKDRQMKIEQDSRHTPYGIIDMKSAYQKVVDSKHTPTDGEVAYRQFTSSELNIRK